MMPTPVPLRLYTGLSSVAGPLLYMRVARKLRAAGTTPERVEERKGYATEARPRGQILWCHAASVGESLSVLPLIQTLGTTYPNLSFLLTSGTATSAQIVADRLPPRTHHQFAPIDTPRAVDRFLQHWRPSAGVFVESELWPNMLGRAHTAGIPLALVNARISDRSAHKWAKARKTAQHLMQHFRVIHCQDQRTVEHLHALGLDQASAGQNLKAMSAQQPIDIKEKHRLERLIKARPLWLAASTHPGEDDIMLAAHTRLLRDQPDALLVLVPRHPERARDIEKLIGAAQLTAARRSQGEDPDEDTQVYMADTLGETGLWYALSPITCLCGSFTPVGGHNPFEPAQGGSAILHGPLYANFATVYAAFDKQGAAQEVTNSEDLSAAVRHLLKEPDHRATMAKRAMEHVNAQNKGLDQIAKDLSKALGLGSPLR